MIVDSSALIALIFSEPLAEVVERRLQEAETVAIGAPTLTETSLVLAGRLGSDPLPLLGRLLQEFAISVVPFSEAHWAEATDAFLRFGKGRHEAGLNFGDCMAYAVARLSDQPLLALGADFPRTDVRLEPLS
jgi:ribonuclease VapC